MSAGGREDKFAGRAQGGDGANFLESESLVHINPGAFKVIEMRNYPRPPENASSTALEHPLNHTSMRTPTKNYSNF